MQYIVKGMFQMTVEARSASDAKNLSVRMLRNGGVEGVAIEATKNSGDGAGGSGGKRKKRGTRNER